MGSPLASLSATRGWSVKVEPSASVPVCGQPWAAAEPSVDGAAVAGAAVAGAAVAALDGALEAPDDEHALTINVAAVRSASAPRDPDSIGSSSSV